MITHMAMQDSRCIVRRRACNCKSSSVPDSCGNQAAKSKVGKIRLLSIRRSTLSLEQEDLFSVQCLEKNMYGFARCFSSLALLLYLSL